MKTPSLYRFQFLIAVLYLLLASLTGCTRSSAQQGPTEGMSLTAIPMSDEWMKGHAKLISADGKTLWFEYWPKSGSGISGWKNLIWTEKDGLKRTDTLPTTIATPMNEYVHRMMLDAKAQQWKAQHRSELDAKRKELNSPQVNVMDMTPDGSIVVGDFLTRERHSGPCFLWREDTGMIFLDEVTRRANISVSAEFGQKDSLLDLKRISADATTIVGGEAPVWRLYNPKGFGKNGHALGIEWSELRLDGSVKSKTKDRLVLLVTGVTEPDGKRTALPHAREKAILLLKGFVLSSGIKVGAKVIVTGSDDGIGKPMTARIVELAK